MNKRGHTWLLLMYTDMFLLIVERDDTSGCVPRAQSPSRDIPSRLCKGVKRVDIKQIV